ncbi:putative lipoyltransferase-like protein, chloroplastic-like protein [Corchorus olitorius]|uniref:Lipoyltransferase-like protein, chloroplastic-like protein n=1 Tax=Corchorus olitorius TaxID=93759 RepID=A0A1R3IL03_9ROSI|nr:putative lipoyltransferase-like protein, chloroplastic-like protein [Corchorus olitorius]
MRARALFYVFLCMKTCVNFFNLLRYDQDESWCAHVGRWLSWHGLQVGFFKMPTEFAQLIVPS